MPIQGGPAPSPTGAPAVDLEAGLARLMGNRQIHGRALARFAQDYRDAGAAIRAALDAGNLAGAQRLVHTLKGAAAMIEAGALHAGAVALEQALRRGETDVRALLLRTEAALAAVLRELDAMAPAPADSPAPPAGPHTLARLRAMLDIGDGSALELVAAMRAELAAELGEREYEGLCAAVMMFDYEHALALLDRHAAAGK